MGSWHLELWKAEDLLQGHSGLQRPLLAPVLLGKQLTEPLVGSARRRGTNSSAHLPACITPHALPRCPARTHQVRS